MDPSLLAIAILVYTLLIVWFVRRPAGQDDSTTRTAIGRSAANLDHIRSSGAPGPPGNAGPSGPSGPAGSSSSNAQQVRSQPTIDRVFAREDRSESREPANVQHFTRRMAQPARSRSRSRTRAPSVPMARPRSRSRSRVGVAQVARPRSRSRSRSQADPIDPKPVQAVPLLPTISGSSISASSVPTVSTTSADPSERRMSVRDVPRAHKFGVFRGSDGLGPFRDPQLRDFRELPPIIRDDTLSATHFRGAATPLAQSTESTVRGDGPSAQAIPPSTVGSSTLARNFTSLTLNTRSSVAPSDRDATPVRAKLEDDEYNPFVPSTPVSSASRANTRGRSSAMSWRTPTTPQSTPGGRSRGTFPMVARTQDGIPIRRCDRSVSQKGADPIVTYWYQADEIADDLLETPPDLTFDRELCSGDLYYHCTPTRYQFWLWMREGSKKMWWEPVLCGYKRKDGRYLIITKNEKFPSWVGYDQYRRALADYL